MSYFRSLEAPGWSSSLIDEYHFWSLSKEERGYRGVGMSEKNYDLKKDLYGRVWKGTRFSFPFWCLRAHVTHINPTSSQTLESDSFQHLLLSPKTSHAATNEARKRAAAAKCQLVAKIPGQCVLIPYLIRPHKLPSMPICRSETNSISSTNQSEQHPVNVYLKQEIRQF